MFILFMNLSLSLSPPSLSLYKYVFLYSINVFSLTLPPSSLLNLLLRLAVQDLKTISSELTCKIGICVNNHFNLIDTLSYLAFISWHTKYHVTCMFAFICSFNNLTKTQGHNMLLKMCGILTQS